MCYLDQRFSLHDRPIFSRQGYMVLGQRDNQSWPEEKCEYEMKIQERDRLEMEDYLKV